MFPVLKRHPLAIEAHFEYSLVLTFAFPAGLLSPLLPPGLTLDTYGECGFVAIALVRTRDLRPAFLPPSLGRDFFLSGYRIFARHRTASGRTLRGLRILRSDTDSRFMTLAGNLLTHYKYRTCEVREERGPDSLQLLVTTARGEADLDVRASLDPPPSAPPAGSPFPDLAVARRFAGPLPYTFEHEAATGSIVMVEGVRTHWNPRPVAVEVRKSSFLEGPPYREAPARLANAFFLEHVDYRWKRGVLDRADGAAVALPADADPE
jgi:hypothetical protein